MFTRKKLEEAVRQDDSQGTVTALAAKTSRNNYRKACSLAVECNAPKALKALFAARRGFDFTPRNSEDRMFVGQLIRAAEASPAAVPLLTSLFETNQRTRFSSVGHGRFLNARTPPEIIQFCLEKEPELFSTAINKIGLDSTEKLAFILSFASKIPQVQETLDQALVKVAAKGDVGKAELLLARKANPDSNGGQPLLHAAQNGFKDMVDLLLPKTDIAFLNDIAVQLSLKEVPQDIIGAIKKAAPAQTAYIPDAAKIPANDDTLTKTRALQDGSTLQILFDFSLRQQFSLAATPQGTAALTVTSFDDLPEGVEKALNEERAARSNGPAQGMRTTIRTV